MRTKIFFTVVLLVMLYAFSGCRMHDPHGTPYRTYHVSNRTHRHWGIHRSTSGRERYWGRHRRYGPRSYRSRGHFRQYQNQ